MIYINKISIPPIIYELYKQNIHTTNDKFIIKKPYIQYHNYMGDISIQIHCTIPHGWELLLGTCVMMGIIVVDMCDDGNYCCGHVCWWELLLWTCVMMGIIVVDMCADGNYCCGLVCWWELLLWTCVMIGIIVGDLCADGNYYCGHVCRIATLFEEKIQWQFYFSRMANWIFISGQWRIDRILRIVLAN